MSNMSNMSNNFKSWRLSDNIIQPVALGAMLAIVISTIYQDKKKNLQQNKKPQKKSNPELIKRKNLVFAVFASEFYFSRLMILLWILSSLFAISYSNEIKVDPSELDIPQIKELDLMVQNDYLLHHDLLRCFRDGKFKNMTNAAEIFAKSHYIYSKSFINYLTLVLDKIDVSYIKEPIIENIEEENGNYNEEDLLYMKSNHNFEYEWFNKIPHKFLMQRFMESLHLNTTDLLINKIHFNNPGYKFRNYMIDIYEKSTVCEALSIIGFAIEETVSILYQYIWDGLKNYTNLHQKDIIFFPLHILLDDGHADLLKKGFKYYLMNDSTSYLCNNVKNVIKDALLHRTIMFDEIRQEIEIKQNERCEYDYSPIINEEIELEYNENNNNKDNQLNGITQLNAVNKAKEDTLKLMNQNNKYTFLQKLTLSSRILASDNHGFTLSGQISCRDVNNSDYMWVNVYGKSLEILDNNDFILVDKDLNVIKGNGFPNRATRFHSHIYNNRNDINCIIHTHPLYTSSLSMLNQELIISHMDTMALYKDVQYLPQWPGIPFGDEEGELISNLLSNNGNLYYTGLLSHHGLIVTGENIETVTYRAYFFERAAKMLLQALSAVGGDVNKIQHVKQNLAQDAKNWRISNGPVNAHFNNWANIILRKYENSDLNY